jgi:hypothetical protein
LRTYAASHIGTRRAIEAIGAHYRVDLVIALLQSCAAAAAPEPSKVRVNNHIDISALMYVADPVLAAGVGSI